MVKKGIEEELEKDLLNINIGDVSRDKAGILVEKLREEINKHNYYYWTKVFIERYSCKIHKTNISNIYFFADIF